jgi:3-hydroxyisobutyrate dehydrogenase-like beta-hydroxyacid dehydrogenase
MPGPDDQIPSDPTSPHRLQAGVIGLGTIGRGIATCFAHRNRTVTVHDVRPEASDGLPGPPAHLGSPAAVAGVSDVIVIAVVDAKQVCEVVTGPDGILTGARPGLVVVVTSTISVEVIRELAERCEEHGVALLDCGVTRGREAAERGLIALVGGPPAEVERIRPLLDDFSARIHFCGPVGSGMACKLANQIVTAGRWRAAHEALQLATASGIDPDTLIDVIEASSAGTAHSGLIRLRMSGQTIDQFGRSVRTYQRNVDKDMQAAQELAAATGVTIPLVDLTVEKSDDTFAWLGR